LLVMMMTISDVWFCTADCGWVTGHSYVTYGPLLNGATQVTITELNWSKMLLSIS